jgi:IS5 family transposase
VVGQAKRFCEEIAGGTKRTRTVLQQLVLEGLRQELDAMVPLVKHVMKQTRARIFRGDAHAEGKHTDRMRAARKVGVGPQAPSPSFRNEAG